MKNLPTHQTLGAYRRKIGDLVLTTLSDGYLDVSFDLLSNIAPEEIDQILEAAAVPKRARATIQSYLIQSSTKTVLIDGGAGGMNGWGGELQNSLASVGVAKSDIDLVLLTHGHPDHLGGLATENGEPVFPNAELALSEAELAFWTDDAIINATPEGFRPFFLAARKVFDAYDDRLRMLDSGKEAAAGVEAIALPGHTLGHTGFAVQSGRDKLFIWGDIVHFLDIEVARPDVTIAFDVDASMSAQTRKRTFDMLATEDPLIGGIHTGSPGYLRLRRNDGGYAVVREPWLPALD
ncbi:MBL fold metallo-hydrolase [Rhizobium miluonense]|uniref:Glyoxylase, beta-lactamase superfamily II n=1 Tax=Rhizobium miluonense TaxID=411945 RepID=A0A1C3X197_9HYPH|nr:MBL fold metallo-hydrolase [Rhizobium miluonense]SCB46052.1 Glyoxylase, beta-lactamase superfamily II [Rhizobium miluonense]